MDPLGGSLEQKPVPVPEPRSEWDKLLCLVRWLIIGAVLCFVLPPVLEIAAMIILPLFGHA